MQELEPSPVIVGIHAVTELVSTRPTEIERIHFDKDINSAQMFNLLKLCRRLRLNYQMVPRERLDELAPGTKHQGVVASCPVKAYATLEEVKEIISNSDQGLLLIPASIEDPRNLGALIRSCVAFNVQALLLEQANSTRLTSLVAKASAGMLEHLPVARPRNLEGFVKELKESGWNIVGMEAEARKEPSETDLKGSTLLICGGEHRGIPPYLRKLCTAMVGIPILETAQSLNLSVAAGIMLYECNRQRRSSPA